MNLKKVTTKQMVDIGMFAALLGIMSQIAIPMPSSVPITLQTFAVAFTGIVLSWKLGLASTLVYIFLGAVGVPVFTNFSGGVQVLFNYTGGFIWGFLFLVTFSGIASLVKRKTVSIALMLFGLALCHILGSLQFGLVMNMGIVESALISSFPYLAKDVISVSLAYIVGKQVRKRLISASLL